jgi:hypothetical protein
MPLDKDKLGNRYKCFKCGVKFYDLNREVANCPECGADQADAPVQDLKALIARGKRAPGDFEREGFEDDDEAADEPGEDDDGLFNDDDDDDDEGGADDDEEMPEDGGGGGGGEDDY